MKLSQFGQAKSPFHVEFREDVDKERVIYFSVDGEFYKIKNAHSIEFKLDV